MTSSSRSHPPRRVPPLVVLPGRAGLAARTVLAPGIARRAAQAAAAAPCIAAIPAAAHHSFAMFDQKRMISLEGTVHVFQWTNPHAFIELDVPSGGKVQRWAIELNSPNNLSRQGWRRSSLGGG